MTKLEQLLHGGSGAIWFPEDVARLKASIPELKELSDFTVQNLYHNWGEDYYSTAWLSMDKSSVEEFAQYLREEID